MLGLQAHHGDMDIPDNGSSARAIFIVVTAVPLSVVFVVSLEAR